MDRRHSQFALLGGAIAIAALATASVVDANLVLFNHSPSIPEGLYVRTHPAVVRGVIVTVRARDVAPEAAHARHYDREGDRFIKRVAAVGGQEVCGDGVSLSVGGRQVASAYAQSDRQAPLGWSGCCILDADEVLLLGDSADSFDGRYWGPVNTHLIEGVWRPF